MKKCLMFGATGGIGSTILRKIASRMDIYAVVRDEERGRSIDVPCNTIVLNLRQTGEIGLSMRRNAPFDVVIYCAGSATPNALSQVSLAEIEEQMSVNLIAPIVVARCCQTMMNKGGKLIFITSSSGLQPRPGWSVYSAAKAGLSNFISSISEEMNPYGIKVFNICPGRTATPLRKILAPREDPKTIMQPDEIAELIEFIIFSGAGDSLSAYPIRIHGGAY